MKTSSPMLRRAPSVRCFRRMANRWSTALASRHETGLRIRNLSTGEDRWLKYPVQRDDQESRATRDVLPGYAFTPDGKEVVACFGGKINRIQVATGEAAVVPFHAHVALDLGPQLYFASRVEEGPVRARLIQAPAAIAGRQAPGVLVAHASVYAWIFRAENRRGSLGRCARVSSRLVARRRVHRICHVVAARAAISGNCAPTASSTRSS